MTQQKRRSEQVTPVESLALAKHMIRTGVSTVCYARSLFPDEAFTSKTICGLTIKILTPNTDDSRLLLEWLEKGVFEALSKRYLHVVSLVVLDGTGKDENVIESYDFRVSYPEAGGAAVTTSKHTPKKSHTKEEVTTSLGDMLRALITITHVMADLPDERVVTMRLLYNDRAPKGYQPSFFCAATPEAEQHYTRHNMKMTKVDLGALATEYHVMDLRCHALSDVFVGVEDEEEEEEEESGVCLPPAGEASDFELLAMKFLAVGVVLGGDWRRAAMETGCDKHEVAGTLREWGVVLRRGEVCEKAKVVAQHAASHPVVSEVVNAVLAKGGLVSPPGVSTQSTHPDTQGSVARESRSQKRSCAESTQSYTQTQLYGDEPRVAVIERPLKQRRVDW
eukprot:Sspe_Gene.112112::Locus_94661_Transcript_1_1_Confidence_1.000_Length_1373::g.112112::m.112112